jgi:hypothetical protein
VTGKCDRLARGRDDRAGVGVDTNVHLVAGLRIARGDGDRLAEHVGDPERVDRAHCIPLDAVEVERVKGRARREGISDRDRTGVWVSTDEVAGLQSVQSLVAVELEACRLLGKASEARWATSREAHDDPAIQLALVFSEVRLASCEKPGLGIQACQRGVVHCSSRYRDVSSHQPRGLKLARVRCCDALSARHDAAGDVKDDATQNYLGQHSHALREAVGPHAEVLAQELLKAPEHPTPLTRRRHSASINRQ